MTSRCTQKSSATESKSKSTVSDLTVHGLQNGWVRDLTDVSLNCFGRWMEENRSSENHCNSSKTLNKQVNAVGEKGTELVEEDK